MEGFGQAIQDASSISIINTILISECISPTDNPTQLTEGGMLKGECDHILDPFNRNRDGIAGEAFADDNFDTAEVIGGIPVILSKELLTEAWKP